MIAFPAFSMAINGYRPRPWQTRLAVRLADGDPPAWIIAPTGAGKTGTIDALVWALATQADRREPERTVSVRTVWAIDRRILVDQVFEHASEIARQLDDALGDPAAELHSAAAALLRLAAGLDAGVSIPDQDERTRRDLHPLVVQRWRGGLDEYAALTSPTQPLVATSTVAQIGSRLLFRGYGVGRTSLAIAGGVAACDTTICLDEAHLAEPFRQTVAAIQARRDIERARTPTAPLHAITLTATPPAGVDPATAITIDDEDKAHLGLRWDGPKTLVLREPDGKPEAQLASKTADLVVEEGCATVACVVNRVSTARKVFALLRKRLKDEADVELLIGPQRPCDREAFFDEHGAALFGKVRPERPLVVVATQTLEVGIDADLDGMVTQSASASALVQRLGRLNRSGVRTPARAIAVRDPVPGLYADLEPAAWDWLSSRENANGEIDVSVCALTEDAERPVEPAGGTAPALVDAAVYQLAQTTPRPGAFADPDEDGFLRGVGVDPSADVQVAWRCDLLLDGNRDEQRETDEYRRALLRLAPPQREEMLTVSVATARQLVGLAITGQPVLPSVVPDADVDGGDRVTSPPVRTGEPTGRVVHLVCRGDDVLRGIDGSPENLDDELRWNAFRPGDTIVLPAAVGEQLDGDASDVFVEQRERQGRPAPIRLSRAVFDARRAAETRRPTARWKAASRRLAEVEHLEGDDLAKALGASPVPRALEELVLPLVEEARKKDWVWRLRPTAVGDPEDDPDPDVDEPEDDESPEPERDDEGPLRAWVLVPFRLGKPAGARAARLDPPTLEEHAQAVAERVALFSRRLGLPVDLEQTLVLAARAHDHGKADPRIQDWFAGGAAVAGAEPLAKSTFGDDDPATNRRAMRLAGMPRDLRHEIASVAVLRSWLAANGLPPDLPCVDPELALYLVGAHHGLGRPVPPVPVGGKPALPFAVDVAGIAATVVADGADGWDGGAWLTRFFDVVEKWGPWTAAYLEAILVLADRTVSSEGG